MFFVVGTSASGSDRPATNRFRAFHFPLTGWLVFQCRSLFCRLADDGRIVRCTANQANLSKPDPPTAEVLFTSDQPEQNHHGGWISFGPDGLLCISASDGGAGDLDVVDGAGPIYRVIGK